MSIRYDNECVGCPPELGCLGEACPNRNVPIYICDICGAECCEEDIRIDTISGGHICVECIDEIYPRIETLRW